MRKVVFLIVIFIFCFLIYASAHEKLDGWYTVKAVYRTKNCNYDNVWGYFQDGIEVKRRCYLLLAHRGWGDAPENSLASFKMVKEYGYDGFETDIRFTKDNVAVLSHDDTINRIARNKDFSKIKGTKYINKLTLTELNNYIFPTTRLGKVLKDYSNNKMTTFEETLSYAKDNELFIAVELKEGTDEQIKSLVLMVYQHDMNGSVRYISFNPQLLKEVQINDSHAELQLLDKSIHTKTGTCEPDFETVYCKSITKKGLDEGEEQRKVFHDLLDTRYNTVYINGEIYDEEGKRTSIVSNYPESISKYPALNGEELILADSEAEEMIRKKVFGVGDS